MPQPSVLLTLLLVVTFLSTAVRAQDTFLSWPCKQHTDCKVKGCECFNDAILGKACLDVQRAFHLIGTCPKCVTNANCPAGDVRFNKYTSIAFNVCGSDLRGGRACGLCTRSAMEIVFNDCAVGSKGNPPKDNIPDSISNGSPSGQEANGKRAQCVSSAWLQQRFLSHVATKQDGQSQVLCISRIPALPCATPGHLLRQCVQNGQCKLVSYLEFCATRTDCLSSTMNVSRLRHAFNWSSVRATTAEDSGWIELTSVSAHPYAHRLSLSRIVAFVANEFNLRGLGKFCDSVMSMWEMKTAIDLRRLLSFKKANT